MHIYLLFSLAPLQACAVTDLLRITEFDLSRLVASGSDGRTPTERFDGVLHRIAVVAQGNEAAARKWVGWVRADESHLVFGSLFEANGPNRHQH